MALSVLLAVVSVNAKTEKTDVTTATAGVFYAEKAETTASSLNGIVNDVLGSIGSGSSSGGTIDSVIGSIEGVSGDIDSAIDGFGGAMDSLGGIGDSLGGIGDALGGIGSGSGLGSGLGDIFGGLLGGSSGSGSSGTASTTSAGSGIIIPVPAATQTLTEAQTVGTTDAVEGEAVDFSSSSNPYTKPTAEFTAGDADESIKWLQWIFVYTGYGLKEDGVTGVLDEDTVTVIKKLQTENELPVDGNVTEDVVKAAEILYYQKILGDDVSAIEVTSDATTVAATVPQGDAAEEGSGVSTVLLIVVLVIIWVLAIGAIVFIFIFKKKKDNAAKAASAAASEKSGSGEIGGLSDLFEEAEKNK